MLEYQYKEFTSGFREWEYKDTASDLIIFQNNIGPYLSMDETCLSNGEVYTILTNKDAKGRKGALVAMIKGVKSETVIDALKTITTTKRLSVKEITIDLSPTMMLISKKAFPNASIVNDRFHVQKLVYDAISELRVGLRWELIDKENELMKQAKIEGKAYKPATCENGETKRQLLARSRMALMTNSSKWNNIQKSRTELVFKEFPILKQTYDIAIQLTAIFNKGHSKSVAFTKLAHWYEAVNKLNINHFNSVVQTMQNYYGTILNYFDRRATNASAESFNAKIKAFRSQFRGVRDNAFFIFRLCKLFA